MNDDAKARALVDAIRTRISYDRHEPLDSSIVRLEFRSLGDADAFEQAMRACDPAEPRTLTDVLRGLIDTLANQTADTPIGRRVNAELVALAAEAQRIAEDR